VLKKSTVEEEVKAIKWVVEDLCEACASNAHSGELIPQPSSQPRPGKSRNFSSQSAARGIGSDFTGRRANDTDGRANGAAALFRTAPWQSDATAALGHSAREHRKSAIVQATWPGRIT
jgi:hypothetical protein